MDKIGIGGMTVTNVMGMGVQKGQKHYYRGAEVESRRDTKTDGLFDAEECQPDRDTRPDADAEQTKSLNTQLVESASGFICCFLVWLLDYKLHVDDPVGAVAVHFGNGLWGTLALFLKEQKKELLQKNTLTTAVYEYFFANKTTDTSPYPVCISSSALIFLPFACISFSNHIPLYCIRSLAAARYLHAALHHHLLHDASAMYRRLLRVPGSKAVRSRFRCMTER